ncbi:MAG: HI0074 family nucleotidyltransferase substrate-binding subunit [Cyanobacteria bacterium P01_H01_bin.74]
MNPMIEHHQKKRFEERKQDFANCVVQLKEAIQQPYSPFIRDAVIKRYEFCWETGWKLLKSWLTAEGITVTTPRSVWKEAFAYGLLSGDADVWMQAQKMRNLTTHTYDEAMANAVYDFICQQALVLFCDLAEKSASWSLQQ